MSSDQIPWSDAELSAAVEAYRRMQWLAAAKTKPNKASISRHYRKGPLKNRSKYSFDERMMNISHILEKDNSILDEPSLAENGFRPHSHIGGKIEKTLTSLLKTSKRKEYLALQICKRLEINPRLVTGMKQAGSTIGKDFFVAVCDQLGIPSSATKQECVKELLDHFNILYKSDKCFSKGSTVTTYALALIHAGIDTDQGFSHSTKDNISIQKMKDEPDQMSKNKQVLPEDNIALPGEEIEFEALQITINNKVLYIGALSARDLNRFSAVPSFKPETEHREIASNILSSPISDWQRPPDKTKIDNIRRRFNDALEIMPNPVLVAAQSTRSVTSVEKKIGQQSTGIWVITLRVQENGDDDSLPLWILDGQHRVRGLSKTDLADKYPIPLVMLSIGEQGFTPTQFAKIFAEVSTEAAPLDDLHKEWMQWAFSLDNYAPSAIGELHHDSMETVIHLCEKQSLGTGQRTISPNPFWNKILFNPRKSFNGGLPGLGEGFQFDAIKLKKVIFSKYYNTPEEPGVPILRPEQLAHAMVESILALRDCVNESGTPIDKSVFTGDKKHGTVTLQEAFLQAVLIRLKKVETTNWYEYLKSHGVHSSDWNFSSWVDTLGGNEGNTSRKVAEQIFKKTIGENDKLPGRTQFEQYFQGHGSELELQAIQVDENGQTVRGSEKDKNLYSATGGVEMFRPVSGRNKIQIKASKDSANIGKIDIVCEAKPLSPDYRPAVFRNGKILDPTDESDTSFLIGTHFFGGKMKETTMRIRWEAE